MANKPYSAKLKERHDPVAKRISSQILKDVLKAELIRDNVSEDKGEFLEGFWDQEYLLKNGKKLKVEAEMKDGKWWGEGWSNERPFKYDSIDIPFRKSKNLSELHIVISTCGCYAFLLLRKDMDRSLDLSGGVPKIKNTKYKKNESYFTTPVSYGKFVYKNQDDCWKFWKSIVDEKELVCK